MKLFLSLIMMVFCHTAFAVSNTTYNSDYELVAASQTTQVLGPSTATTNQGDYLDKCIIVPETTGAGTVAIKDGSASAINIFVAGTLSDLRTITVLIGARSSTGSWQVTTGANVHVICTGAFH